MKLVLHRKTSTKQRARMKNKVRIRKKVNGSDERPRLSVFRSAKHMYAQIVNDVSGQTLAAASSLKLKSDASGKEAAQLVGKEIAKQALAKNIKAVVFDRNGFIYHGRIKSLADAAREAGLNF